MYLLVRLFFLLLFCSFSLLLQKPSAALAQFNGCAPGFCGSYAGAVAGTCATMGYQGAGDIIGGAAIGVSLQAWTQALCGTKVANVCVSGVCADMFSSTSNGTLVSQNINGTVCPAASTSSCQIATWYNQPSGTACTGPCDMVTPGGANRPVLTTNCPSPLAVCVISTDSGTATYLHAAGNITLTPPYTIVGVTNYVAGGTYAQYYFGVFGGGYLQHGGVASNTIVSCNGGTTATGYTGVTDGTWYSQLGICGSASTYNLYVDGSPQTAVAWTPSTIPGVPFVTYVYTSGSEAMYSTEIGFWNSDVTSSAAALTLNQRSRFGF
jgi:hypothetical protein